MQLFAISTWIGKRETSSISHESIDTFITRGMAEQTNLRENNNKAPQFQENTQVKNVIRL